MHTILFTSGIKLSHVAVWDFWQVEVAVWVVYLPVNGTAAKPVLMHSSYVKKKVIFGPQIIRRPDQHRGTWMKKGQQKDASNDLIVLDDVKSLQERLVQLGYYSGAVDGW